VRAPLRLIYGKEDRGHAAERAALAMELHPGLDLHVIERCKHLVQWDAGEQFAALCGSFLAEA
jgi:pimeloyl-ACP methyl ester carboxylesterase